MNQSMIYILTNPSFPNYVKIGKTTDIVTRVRALNNPTCLPFSFRVFATYSVSAEQLDVVEKAIHNLIDSVDYELRAREDVDKSRLREREFFAMDAEKAFDLLQQVAILRGDVQNLVKGKQTKQEKADEKLAEVVEEVASRTRGAVFSFKRKGIAPGSIVEFARDPNIKVRVIDDRYVEFEGQTYSLSALGQKLTNSKWSVQGPRFFQYNGELLMNLADKE